MVETTFELRELKSSDIFPMFKIMGKIGFKDLKDKMTPDKVKELTSVFKQNESDDSESVGAEEQMMFVGFNVVFEVVEVIMNNLPSCEQDIYSFLAGLSGMKVKEIANLPLVTFTEMIVEVLKKEEFKDFFKVVSRLFN
jgi:hypothetical protein